MNRLGNALVEAFDDDRHATQIEKYPLRNLRNKQWGI